MRDALPNLFTQVEQGNTYSPLIGLLVALERGSLSNFNPLVCFTILTSSLAEVRSIPSQTSCGSTQACELAGQRLAI